MNESFLHIRKSRKTLDQLELKFKISLEFESMGLPTPVNVKPISKYPHSTRKSFRFVVNERVTYEATELSDALWGMLIASHHLSINESKLTY